MIWILLIFAVWGLIIGVERAAERRRDAERRLSRRMRLRRRIATKRGPRTVQATSCSRQRAPTDADPQQAPRPHGSTWDANDLPGADAKTKRKV